jgi:hypothetical protein
LIIRQTNDKIAHVLINRTLLFAQPPVQTCSFLPIFEIATMKQSTSHFLMIRPAAFGFNTETAASNAFQKSHATGNAQQKALLEFDAMVSQLLNAGVHITVIEDTKYPPKPDAIFPNNWFSTHHDSTVVLYPMQALNRREECRLDVIEQLHQNHGINRLIDLRDEVVNDRFLEGTGSIVFDHQHKIAFACRSSRTDETLFTELCNILGYQPICFDAFDKTNQPIYHTNVVMAIGTNWAVCCTDTIPKNQQTIVLNALNKNHDLIEITQEQMAAFSGNMLELQSIEGDKLFVLSETAYQHLSKQQINTLAKHGRLLPISVSTIEQIGGGSVRCMMAELF